MKVYNSLLGQAGGGGKMGNIRNRYDVAFKAKVAMETVKDMDT